jgi:hypothetical protein
MFHLLLLLLLLLHIPLSDAKEPLYLAYFGPFSGAWPGGIEMEPAVTLAFEVRVVH